MTPLELYAAGNLQAALEAAVTAVEQGMFNAYSVVQLIRRRRIWA